jgi:putative FmdB family regulatory protein
MPTYEYACQKCGHEFDHFQSMSDPLLKKCPKCGKNGLKRLVGAGAGLIFKGSGFYITDYKTKSGKPDDSKTPSATVTSEAKAAKPAAESTPAAPAKPAPAPAPTPTKSRSDAKKK